MNLKINALHVGLLTTVIVVLLLALSGLGATEELMALADSPAPNGTSRLLNAKSGEPPILPPNSTPFGKSYGEWSAAWWQWAYSLPADDSHPLIADGPMDCSLGQGGKVWFLGGTFTLGPDPEAPAPIAILGEADRECTVPVGKALFFPILNAECSALAGDGVTEVELRACAHSLIDAVDPDNLSATIDGVEIGNLQIYRSDSPFFEWGPLPDPNLPEQPPGVTSDAVADGYYLMLPPLSAGDHQIEFEGLVLIPEQEFSFRLDISYDLRVEPPGQ